MKTKNYKPSKNQIAFNGINTVAYLIAVGEKYTAIEQSFQENKSRVIFFNLSIQAKIDEFFNDSIIAAIKYKKNATENRSQSSSKYCQFQEKMVEHHFGFLKGQYSFSIGELLHD